MLNDGEYVNKAREKDISDIHTCKARLRVRVRLLTRASAKP